MNRPITNARQLGARLYDARIQAGLTQAELAERSGASRKWLIDVEKGTRTRAELGKIFDVLQELELSLYAFGPDDSRDAPRARTAKATRSRISASTLEAIRRAREEVSPPVAPVEGDTEE